MAEFLVIGIVVGAVVGWLVGRAMAPTPDASVARDLAEAERRLAASAARAEGFERELAAAREQHSIYVEQVRLEAKDREAAGHAESQVLQQMAPIAAQLRDMQAKVMEIEKQRSHQHGELSAQIKATRETADQSRAAAQMLNSALRNNQVRGAYGEIQLESIVEAAGMLKRVDYTTQESILAESGARRPDMVINLPGGNQLAVDAKAPYAAFIESHRENIDDAQRNGLLRDHAKQVRAHVIALADRSYFTGLQGSPDVTVAFIPSDAILRAAEDADPALTDFAYSKGVVLATPASLFAILKALAYSWKQEDLADDAREVVEMGQVLFHRLKGVAEHAAKLGRSLNTTVQDYNKFVGSMERQLLAQARRFDQMDVALPSVDNDTRQFTAAEFAALGDVARPEIEVFESADSVQRLGEVS